MWSHLSTDDGTSELDEIDPDLFSYSTARSERNRESRRTSAEPSLFSYRSKESALSLPGDNTALSEEGSNANEKAPLSSSMPSDESHRQEYVRSGSFNIHALWESAHALGTEQNLAFVTQVDSMLEEQLHAPLAYDHVTVDRQRAEAAVFAKLLTGYVGEQNALLELTRHKWFSDEQTSVLLKGLLVSGIKADSCDCHGNTALHYLASLGYTKAANALLEHNRELWRVANEKGETPLEKAIANDFDETAIFFLELMTNDEVRGLFSTPGRPPFYSLLTNTQMTKCGHVVMDRMVDEDREGFIVDYRLLDSDRNGLLPGDEGYSAENSCFSAILTRETFYKEFSKERAFRLLLNFKWSTYGEKMLAIPAIGYFLFMVILTYVVTTATYAVDPTEYNSAMHYVRAVFELVALTVICASLGKEAACMYQSRHNWRSYWLNAFNMIQFTAITLCLTVLPLRFAKARSQWVVLSLGYLAMGIYFFKFVSSSRVLGVYTRIAISAFVRVLPQALLLAALSLFIWAGSFYPALRSHQRTQARNGSSSQTDIGVVLETSSFGEILFLGLRALIEGHNLISYHDNDLQLGTLSVIVYLVFLAVAVLLMRAILLAKLINTFSVLHRDAVLALQNNQAWLLHTVEQSVMTGKHWLLLDSWIKKRCVKREHFSKQRMQEILQELEVDGGVTFENALAEQKKLLKEQGQRVREMSDWIAMGERRMVHLFQLVTRSSGKCLSRGMSENGLHTMTSSATDSVHVNIFEQTKDTGARIKEIEARLNQQEKKKRLVEAILSQIGEKMIRQDERSRHQISLLQDLARAEGGAAKQREAQLDKLMESVAALGENDNVTAQCIDQQGLQLAQLTEMVQSLEVTASTIMTELINIKNGRCLLDAHSDTVDRSVLLHASDDSDVTEVVECGTLLSLEADSGSDHEEQSQKEFSDERTPSPSSSSQTDS